MTFKVHILGCGSATPTIRRNPTSQVVNVLERHFLIDCAEGTQLQMRKFGIKFQKINNIFISHLHGDHYLGLMGFISTLHLYGRTKDLNIYAPKELDEIINNQIRASKSYINFNINFIHLTSKTTELIYEDDKVTVETIPLKHRIYCNGFLIKEKQHKYRIDIDAVKKHNIPIAWFQHLKEGKDFTTNEIHIPVTELTFPPYEQRSYAYCSDTAYNENIIPIIKNTQLLYHEATFLNNHKDRAKQTMHSTIEDACNIAQKSNVDRLLVGHYSARYKDVNVFKESAIDIFKDTTPVKDGDVFEIPLK